ncbi:hypothetical protein VV01_20690 [Luteipulveratus halotolerans]|uniref:Uncharacterized protein n=1 Tax=Luteipulveratus halotolerans TaxID=1631356 RepID=A0A0L6CMP5_9MICO|nr:hypothetical protein VV01_20690 [Luteipulveratus halotolerans]
MPTAAAATISSPRSCARRATQNPATAAMTASSSHGALLSMPSRISTPRIDWLDVPSLGPSRAGSCSAPPQNANDACGSSTSALSVTVAAVTMLVIAARHCLDTMKWTMNTPGVSLIAVASPTSTPWGTRSSSRCRGRIRSSRHASTRNALTCPKRNPSDTGSR